MKKIIISLGIILLLITLIIYSFCTVNGSLRSSIFFQYPIKAVTTEFIDITEEYERSNGDLNINYPNGYKVFKLTKPPYHKGTDAILENWIVEKNGNFYSSFHLGYFN